MHAYTVRHKIIQWGKNTQKCPFLWDFITLLEENRATAIGKMHRKTGKDRACGSRDILADRQTNRQTVVLSQYFTTTLASKVISTTYM